MAFEWDTERTFREFAAHVSRAKAAFFREAGIDLVMGERDGPFVWSLDGTRRLIDCHTNGGVFNLGHRDPELIATLVAALEWLDIGNHHLVSEPRARLAAALAERSPEGLEYVVFAVGGGEAVDLAIKVARASTRRAGIVSVRGGYHGHTGLALAAGDPRFREPFGPLAPGFVQVPFGDVDALARAVDGDTAAVILETVPATGGIVVGEPAYFAAVREITAARGALYIADEVQTGLGRTGRFWAFEHFGVVPDVIVTGKGLSGGLYPIAATILRADLEEVFHPDPFVHISTFGGAEVGCEVALEVVRTVSDPSFLERVRRLGERFEDGFAALAGRAPAFVRLRRLGMMMGIEMAHPACGPLFSRAAYDEGLLAAFCANDPRVAQLLPPLTIGDALADEIVERAARALERIEVP